MRWKLKGICLDGKLEQSESVVVGFDMVLDGRTVNRV